MCSSHNVSLWLLYFWLYYICVARSTVNGQTEAIFVDGPYNVIAPAQGPILSPVSEPEGPCPAYPQTTTFSVIDFGAIADDATDNSLAFVEAWEEACATEESLLVVPPGVGAYLLNGCKFKGPCVGSTELQIDGVLRAYPDTSISDEYWIMFSHVNDLTVHGAGTFDGNGAATWERRRSGEPSTDFAPTSIKFFEVANGVLQGLTSSNSKMFHVVVEQCDEIMIRDMTIAAPADSPNTDGIHIGLSDNIKILSSSIGTGDDCISIGGGSSNVDVTGVQCGPGHGISIGSLGRDQIEYPVSMISVTNCTLRNTKNGLRIKTFAHSPQSTASDITYTDILMNNSDNPIIIDQRYCPHGNCINKVGDSNIAISTVKYINVQGTSASPTAIKVVCSHTHPCQEIEFSSVNLSFNGQPAIGTCFNAQYAFLTENQVPPDCPAPIFYTYLYDY